MNPSPHIWQIECLEFTPSTHRDPSRLLGFVVLGLPGGLQLDARVLRMPAGPSVVFPKRCAIQNNEPARYPNGDWMVVSPVAFPKTNDWITFNRAAIDAILRAYPDAFAVSSASPEARTPPVRPAPITYCPETSTPVSMSLPDFLTIPVTTRIN